MLSEESVVNKDYIVPIKGLSTGKYQFDYIIDSQLFVQFEESMISAADVNVCLTLDKQPSFININGVFKGVVTTACDRCLEDVIIELNFESSLMVKFTKEREKEEVDEIMVLDPSESELDLSQFYYDYITLALPLQRVHKKGECNPQMVEKIEGISNNNEVEQKKSSPFDKLKNLMN